MKLLIFIIFIVFIFTTCSKPPQEYDENTAGEDSETEDYSYALLSLAPPLLVNPELEGFVSLSFDGFIAEGGFISVTASFQNYSAYVLLREIWASLEFFDGYDWRVIPFRNPIIDIGVAIYPQTADTLIMPLNEGLFTQTLFLPGLYRLRSDLFPEGITGWENILSAGHSVKVEFRMR